MKEIKFIDGDGEWLLIKCLPGSNCQTSDSSRYGKKLALEIIIDHTVSTHGKDLMSFLKTCAPTNDVSRPRAINIEIDGSLSYNNFIWCDFATKLDGFQLMGELCD